MDTPAQGAPAFRPLHVAHILHNLGPGGAQELLVILASHAPAVGVRLSVVCLTPTLGSAHSRRLEELGTPVVALGLTGSRDPLGPQRVRQAVRRLRPHVLHTHGKHADLLAALTTRLSPVPRVSTVHLVEHPATISDRALLGMVARARRSHGGRTVMVSRHQRDQYVAAYPRSAPSTEVIYNGVPTPALRNGAGVRDQADPPHVLALGLMRPDRGHRTLIDAAEHLSPHVRVLVAGDGPLREELVARARRSSGRGAEVQFLGYRSDLSALLRRADILVHPSLTDALPTAVIHALAHGVPVVASAVGGIPEIVSPDVGILVPPGESRSLANAVTELLEDPVRRQAMSVAGVRRHEMMFSAGGWAASLRDRYVNLLSQR